jgi:hypothetical protein
MSTKATGPSFTVCIASAPGTIDPALNTTVDGGTYDEHLFEGLYRWSYTGTYPDGAVPTRSGLSQSGPDEVTNTDGTVTYTYTLRDGLKWSMALPYGWRHCPELEARGLDRRLPATTTTSSRRLSAARCRRRSDGKSLCRPDDKTLSLPWSMQALIGTSLRPSRPSLRSQPALMRKANGLLRRMLRASSAMVR